MLGLSVKRILCSDTDKSCVFNAGTFTRALGHTEELGTFVSTAEVLT